MASAQRSSVLPNMNNVAWAVVADREPDPKLRRRRLGAIASPPSNVGPPGKHGIEARFRLGIAVDHRKTSDANRGREHCSRTRFVASREVLSRSRDEERVKIWAAECA